MTNAHLRSRIKKLRALTASQGPDVHTFLAAMQRSSDRVAGAVLSGDLPLQHAPDTALIMFARESIL